MPEHTPHCSSSGNAGEQALQKYAACARIKISICRSDIKQTRQNGQRHSGQSFALLRVPDIRPIYCLVRHRIFRSMHKHASAWISYYCPYLNIIDSAPDFFTGYHGVSIHNACWPSHMQCNAGQAWRHEYSNRDQCADKADSQTTGRTLQVADPGPGQGKADISTTKRRRACGTDNVTQRQLKHMKRLWVKRRSGSPLPASCLPRHLYFHVHRPALPRHTLRPCHVAPGFLPSRDIHYVPVDKTGPGHCCRGRGCR